MLRTFRIFGPNEKFNSKPAVVPFVRPAPVPLKGPVTFVATDGNTYNYMMHGGDCLWDMNGTVLPYKKFSDCFEMAIEAGFSHDDFVATRNGLVGAKFREQQPLPAMAKTSKKPNYGSDNDGNEDGPKKSSGSRKTFAGGFIKIG